MNRAPVAQTETPTRAMTWIPGGTFLMGSDQHYPEEAPARRVTVDGFWIDTHPVTNRDFADFVEATGWITSAEIAPDAADYPGARPELLTPASLVFAPPVLTRVITRDTWWRYTPGANWRRPAGPNSDLTGLWDHPVVHVAWRDVVAYAAWARLDLPTEAEWEFAARGGLEAAEYAWGDTFTPGGEHLANTWQGAFPFENTLEDGWPRTSPVGAYPANGYGLVDMIGNVWEWTADWWSTPRRATEGKACCTARNPLGGSEGESADHRLPGLSIPRKVVKGGSHLCAPNYCRRYRPAARHPHPVDTSTSHVGFRCVGRP